MANATLASVFRFKNDSRSWKKLNSSEIYFKLQSAFWGKKIEDDAQRWRGLQPAMEDDDDNDIGPGCYVLDLNIELKCSKLWVRKDYIRIYDYCTMRHEEGPRYVKQRARSVVITGQPGVGKTYWVTYAVRRRLGEQKPFLLFRGNMCFLFVKEGVYEKKLEDVDASRFAPFLWAFVNADSHSAGVPAVLIDDTNLYIMFTTSSESMRWKALSRSTALIVVVMNSWFPREILLAAEKIHDFTGEQLNVAEAYLEKLGPVPRLCIDYVQDRAEALQHKDLCQGMIANLTSESLRKIVFDRRVFNLDEGSHWHLIFLVRRNELDVLERAYLEPISADVAIRFMTAINELQRLERIDLYHLFASVNDSRAVAGLAYESLGHTFLQEGVTLTLTPMIKTYARTLFHWKAQGEEQTSDSMDLDNSEITVSFPPNAAIVYEGTQTPIQPNHLYVPKARNKVALDSFFKLDPNLYIFQFNVANAHHIKKGLEKSFAGQENIPPKTGWRFVYITPPGCEVDVKATSEVEQALGAVTLYSARLEIEQRMSLIAPS